MVHLHRLGAAMRNGFRRFWQALIVLPCIAALAAAPVAAQGTYSTPSRTYGSDYPPGHEEPQHHDDNTGAIIAAILGTIAIGCIAACERSHSPVSNSGLLKNGPVIDSDFLFGQLSVHGLVRSNWPFVVDFRSERGATTWAVIGVGKRQPLLFRLGNSRGGWQTFTFRLPEALGAPEPVGAAVRICSTTTDTGSDAAPPSVDSVCGANASALQVIGIGCGPSAVGSVAIEQLRFVSAPAPQAAQYTYHTKSAFNQLVSEVIRFTPKPDGSINAARVRQLDKASAAVNATPRGWWDGRDDHAHASHGVHFFQVRGWMNNVDDKSWVGAMSWEQVALP